MKIMTLNRCLIVGIALLTLAPAVASAAGAPDLGVRAIDVSGLECGPCGGTVEVEIENTGSALGGGYNVFVELRVTPAGDAGNAKTYKQHLRGFAATSTQRVTFSDVQIHKCYGAASSFVAKVYVAGGNFREGNTRNNEKRLSVPVTRRCPGASASEPAQASSPASNPVSNPQPAAGGTIAPAAARGNTGRALGAPDLAIQEIDVRRLTCGGCGGPVTVTVNNSGREIGGGYNVFVELRVTPAGDAANAKTYKQHLRGFPGGEAQPVTFDDVQIHKCYGVASTFAAKVYVVGGSFREGNTRNNQKSVSVPVTGRCR